MKYIKEYNDVDYFDEGYFTEITLSEYNSLLSSHKKLKFVNTNRENIWLDKLNKWGNITFNIDWRGIWGENYHAITFMLIDDNRNEISGVILILSDDWYLVELSLHSGKYIRNVYYKCDQVDGLVNFFKSLKQSNLSINEDFYYLYDYEIYKGI